MTTRTAKGVDFTKTTRHPPHLATVRQRAGKDLGATNVLQPMWSFLRSGFAPWSARTTAPSAFTSPTGRQVLARDAAEPLLRELKKKWEDEDYFVLLRLVEREDAHKQPAGARFRGDPASAPPQQRPFREEVTQSVGSSEPTTVALSSDIKTVMSNYTRLALGIRKPAVQVFRIPRNETINYVDGDLGMGEKVTKNQMPLVYLVDVVPWEEE